MNRKTVKNKEKQSLEKGCDKSERSECLEREEG
jgi:hypothetical protein